MKKQIELMSVSEFRDYEDQNVIDNIDEVMTLILDHDRLDIFRFILMNRLDKYHIKNVIERLIDETRTEYLKLVKKHTRIDWEDRYNFISSLTTQLDVFPNTLTKILLGCAYDGYFNMCPETTLKEWDGKKFINAKKYKDYNILDEDYAGFRFLEMKGRYCTTGMYVETQLLTLDDELYEINIPVDIDETLFSSYLYKHYMIYSSKDAVWILITKGSNVAYCSTCEGRTEAFVTCYVSSDKTPLIEYLVNLVRNEE